MAEHVIAVVLYYYRCPTLYALTYIGLHSVTLTRTVEALGRLPRGLEAVPALDKSFFMILWEFGPF